MEFTELKSSLKSKKPSPCYACYGDDDFLVERAVSLIGELASELKPFNYVDKTFASGKELVDELMQLPVACAYRVVVARGKPDVGQISKYLTDPNPTTVLVLPTFLPADSWNKFTPPAVPQGATTVICDRVGARFAFPFVRSIANKTGASIDDKTADALCKRCGWYMTRIKTETEKLAVLRAGSSITAADVAEHVEADAEFLVFELCDSILAGNAARALTVVDGMAKNNDLTAAFTLCYNRFRRIFAAAVDPDGLSGIGVAGFQATKLKAESAKLSRMRLKTILDMLEKADHDYKTGAMTVYDALTGFVAQASYRGAN